jgi:methionyl-tRNA formyltransferase
MRIIFMGTPAFAVESLKVLHQSNHAVVAVITAIDKPAGRGRKLNQSAVKEYALSENLNILQPNNLKDEGFLEQVKAFNADMFVVVAFRMLPKVLWSLPKYGTFNLHSSLLPDYRGAAPINWVLVNGETKTGVTTFFINEDIDTGEILLQEETQIGADEDAGALHDRLMAIGAGLVLKTANGLASDVLKPQAQESNSHLNDAPKIFKEDLRINPAESREQVYNLIRGMSPFPGAWGRISIDGQEKTLKIFQSEMYDLDESFEVGELRVLDKNNIILVFKDGALRLKSLQIEGKRRMSSQDFINGRLLEKGAIMI